MLLYPRPMKLKGVYWFHAVRLSVCGENGVQSVSSTILAGFTSYLHILSNNIRNMSCAKFVSNLKIWSSGKFFKFVTLILSYFDWVSNMKWSIIWVIMGWWGYPQNASILVILVYVTPSKFQHIQRWHNRYKRLTNRTCEPLMLVQLQHCSDDVYESSLSETGTHNGSFHWWPECFMQCLISSVNIVKIPQLALITCYIILVS